MLPSEDPTGVLDVRSRSMLVRHFERPTVHPRPAPATALALFLLCIATVSPPALASGGETSLLSVLALDVGSTTLAPQEKASLEEAIRTTAGDLLAPAGITVLTNETQLQLFVDNGVDPDRACDASCHLEAARELKARWFISGVIVPEGAELVAFIRLFDTGNGRQLSSVQIEGGSVRELRRSFNERAEHFFERAGLVREKTLTPTPTPQPERIAGGYLDITLSPPHASLWIGNVPAQPGLNGPLPAGPHRIRADADQHRPSEVVAFVEDDLTKSVSLTLAPLPSQQLQPMQVQQVDWRAPRHQPADPVLPITPGRQLQFDPPAGIGTPWTRTYVGLGPGYFAWEVGGRGHWAFRIGLPELSARWYADPHGDGMFVTLGLPFGLGYQWKAKDGVIQVGFPQLVAVGF